MKKLCMKNGRFCAICHAELILKNEGGDETILAEEAHIYGRKSGSARYDPTMTDDQRNSSNNLILLCRNCHKKSDSHTSEELIKIKQDYESWVSQRLKTEIGNITFAELDMVTKYLISGHAKTDDSYTIVSPKDKIKKNALSPVTEQLITTGMIQAHQVTSFINNYPDSDFGDRLKEGFVTEYKKLKDKEKLSGDDLFKGLMDFASGRSNDFKQIAAGLAVLVYLFGKCEVFEK